MMTSSHWICMTEIVFKIGLKEWGCSIGLEHNTWGYVSIADTLFFFRVIIYFGHFGVGLVDGAKREGLLGMATDNSVCALNHFFWKLLVLVSCLMYNLIWDCFFLSIFNVSLCYSIPPSQTTFHFPWTYLDTVELSGFMCVGAVEFSLEQYVKRMTAICLHPYHTPEVFLF